MTTTPKPERLKQIIALWNDTAMSQTGIGKVVGLPRGSVGRILSEARRSGMTVTRRTSKPRKPPLTDDQIAWAVAARRAGRPLREVAAVLDRGIQHTCRMVRAACTVTAARLSDPPKPPGQPPDAPDPDAPAPVEEPPAPIPVPPADPPPEPLRA
jgi:hypothetical protein